MHPIITSHQNPKIKLVLSLEKSRERKKQGLFIIEGKKETDLAIAGKYQIKYIFYCEGRLNDAELAYYHQQNLYLIPVKKEIFEKLSYRESSSSVISIAVAKAHPLAQLKINKANPLILVVESVEKPGNLGALLRTADAAALDGVIICNQQTDFYNPNVIRSSVGCLFTTPLAAGSSEEVIAWLKQNKVKMFCTYLGASKKYYESDFTGASAIIMGTEASGLSDTWVKQSDQNIIIPMLGRNDSLNVSAAAAIVIFEALRQRGFKK
ncbi:MAG TPA: RNA methyltransferase [Cyclobacteriaceae bacterium]|nr:RNA methyltransferase [Cyclobacteriaceae bacterium]